MGGSGDWKLLRDGGIWGLEVAERWGALGILNSLRNEGIWGLEAAER